MKPKKIALITALIAGMYFLGSARVFGQQYTLSPNGNICGTTATLTLSGSQSGVAYQLEIGGNTLVGSPVTGTGSALTWTNISVPSANEYVEYVVVARSTIVATTVIFPNPLTGNVTASNGGILYPGGSVTLTVNITRGTAVDYYWYKNGSYISSGVSSTYTATTAGNYTVTAVSNCDDVVLTSTVTTGILPGMISPATETTPQNIAGGVLTGTLPAVWTGTYTYQWQSSADGNTWAIISGATGPNYSPIAQTATVYYRRELINGTLTAYSNISQVQISDCYQLNTTTGTTNNIISSTFRMPGVTSGITDAQIATMGVCNANQTIQYFDGLGRPLQTVEAKASPLGNDIVEPVVYDQYGREANKYLPYVTPGSNNGAYRSAAIGEQATYYNPTNSTILTQQPNGIVNTSFPYAQTNFEPSPLNRVVEQGAPGAAWQPVTGNTTGHTNKITYTTNNTTALSDTANSYYAALYTVTINADQSRTLVQGTGTNAYYAAGQLYVTVMQDENWKSGRGGTTEEYKDKEGHVVLKRTYNWVGGVLQQLSTYYVYDDLGNLAFVLTPKSGGDGGIPAQTILDNLCYQYRYDSRNRLVQKKLPGKGWEFMVYNTLNQLVMTQDAVQHSNNQWTVIKYDALGRTLVTGLWNAGSAIAPATLQASIYAGAQWDVRDATNNTTTNPTGYVISSYPALSKVLTINYYDNYTFTGQPATFATPTGASTMTRGLPTGTKTAVLNTIGNATPDMLWKVSYYDDLGRPTQTYAQHYLGGVLSPYNYDKVINMYDFANEDTSTTRYHYNTTNTSTPVLTAANRYVYDHEGRKKQTWEAIASGSTVLPTPILLSLSDYNEIGQLLDKKLHSSNSGGSFLQEMDYTYNERGWLKTSSAPLFAMQLNYNDGTTPQYNGNISNQLWGTPGSLTKNYAYRYDNLNRLVSGIASTGNTEKSIVYDSMGNITGLQRYLTNTEADALKYNYIDVSGNATNQLQSITDSTTNDAGMKHGTFTYAYDGNGNMATDNSKGLTLTYNMLNLPSSITITGTSAGTVTYVYDANGTKLRKVSTQGTGSSTDYIDGIEYDATSTNTPAIAFVQTEEGRAINLVSSWNYEYNLADHLGDSRLSFDTGTGVAKTQQQDDYMPFGMDISVGTIGSPPNHYLYNKKEFQAEPGLGLYDYGARFYDPVIARWTTVDPLAEISRRFSPYNYGENNPISNIDPDGMDVVQNGNVTTYTGADIAGYIAAQAAGQADGEADVQKVLQQSDPGKKSKKQKKDQSANSFWSWSAWSSAIPVWNQAGIASDLINRGHYFGAAAAEINGVFELSGLTELGGFFYNGIGGLFTKEVVTTTADAAATNGETASTAFGKAMHKAYKAGIEDGVTKFKEFTGVKGVRPDFVDFETKTIYELKPNNNRAIKQGLEQLNKYKALFEKQYGGAWKIVLEHY
jgi:RHS repeat-associated protein